MSKQEEIFRRYEKLAKAAKKSAPKQADKPGSCPRCIYYRPDFRYRKCRFGNMRYFAFCFLSCSPACTV